MEKIEIKIGIKVRALVSKKFENYAFACSQNIQEDLKFGPADMENDDFSCIKRGDWIEGTLGKTSQGWCLLSVNLV